MSSWQACYKCTGDHCKCLNYSSLSLPEYGGPIHPKLSPLDIVAAFLQARATGNEFQHVSIAFPFSFHSLRKQHVQKQYDNLAAARTLVQVAVSLQLASAKLTACNKEVPHLFQQNACDSKDGISIKVSVAASSYLQSVCNLLEICFIRLVPYAGSKNRLIAMNCHFFQACELLQKRVTHVRFKCECVIDSFLESLFKQALFFPGCCASRIKPAMGTLMHFKKRISKCLWSISNWLLCYAEERDDGDSTWRWSLHCEHDVSVPARTNKNSCLQKKPLSCCRLTALQSRKVSQIITLGSCSMLFDLFSDFRPPDCPPMRGSGNFEDRKVLEFVTRTLNSVLKSEVEFHHLRCEMNYLACGAMMHGTEIASRGNCLPSMKSRSCVWSWSGANHMSDVFAYVKQHEMYFKNLWSSVASWIPVYSAASFVCNGLCLEFGLIRVCYQILRCLESVLFNLQDDAPCVLVSKLMSICSFTSSYLSYVEWDQAVCSTMVAGSRDKCRYVARISADVGVTETVESLRVIFSSLLQQFVLSSKRFPTLEGSAALNDVTWICSSSLSSLCFAYVWIRSRHKQFLSLAIWESALVLGELDLALLKTTIEAFDSQIMNLQRLAGHPSASYLLAVLEYLDRSCRKLGLLSGMLRDDLEKVVQHRSASAWAQHLPKVKIWRRRGSDKGPDLASPYVRVVVHQVLAPIINAMSCLSVSGRSEMFKVCLKPFILSWMSHILDHGIKFSMYGALQLNLDIESFREWIGSDGMEFSEDQLETIQNMPCIIDFLHGVALLQCQPVKKGSSSHTDVEASSESLASNATVASSMSQGSMKSLFEERIESINCPNKERWLALRVKRPASRRRLFCLHTPDL